MKAPLDRTRLLRPSRRGLDEIGAVVREGGGDAEVWERLAVRGWIPAGWVANERRGFGDWCPHCKGLGFITSGSSGGTCPVCEGATFVASEAPAPALACALAADVEGVTVAEALVEEFNTRLLACGVQAIGPRVRWRLAPAPVLVALRHWRTLGRVPYTPFAGYGRCAFDAAVLADEQAAETSTWASDPFDPLFRLYERGYALDTVMRSGAILAVPAP